MHLSNVANAAKAQCKYARILVAASRTTNQVLTILPNESSAEMFLGPCAENSKRRRPVSQLRHMKRQSSWFVVFLREHAKRIMCRREPLLKAWKNSKPMGLLIIRLRSGRMPFAFSEMRVRTTLGGKFHATIQRMRSRSLRHSSTISMY